MGVQSTAKWQLRPCQSDNPQNWFQEDRSSAIPGDVLYGRDR